MLPTCYSPSQASALRFSDSSLQHRGSLGQNGDVLGNHAVSLYQACPLIASSLDGIPRWEFVFLHCSSYVYIFF